MAIQKRQYSLMKQLNVAITKADFKLIIKIESILNKAPFGGQSVRNILKKNTKIKRTTRPIHE
jgi:flagellar basal body P-ring protein FlgI